MNAVIFADVHLRAGEAGMATQRDLVSFLRSIDVDTFPRVIVLGDLFDFWFEYRHVIFSSYFESLRAFAELRDRGAELHLICGNHDFWAGRFLEDELGFQVHRVAYETTFGDRRVRLIHGDGVNANDYGYRMYKRFARSRFPRKPLLAHTRRPLAMRRDDRRRAIRPGRRGERRDRRSGLRS